MPRPGRKSQTPKKIDRSKQSTVSAEIITRTVDTEAVFQLIVSGKSIASIARELKMSSRQVSDLVRSALNEISLEIAELRQQYVHQTIHQVDHLIEVGLGMLTGLTKDDVGTWRIIATTYMDLVKLKKEVLGAPVGTGPDGTPPSVPGTIQIMNVGQITPTITNSKEDPLMAAANAEFFAKAFGDKHRETLADYAKEQFDIEGFDPDNKIRILANNLEIKSLPDEPDNDEE